MTIPPRHLPWACATAGLAMGLVDTALLRLIGLQMLLGDADATLPIWLLLSGTFGGMGYVIGLLWQARIHARADAQVIAAQVRALEDARARQVEAETLAALGRMAAGVAHEVRNPLGVIRSSAALIAEDPTAPDSGQACTFIIEEVDRLDGFVRRVLDFSRPVRPERSAVPAHRLIDRAMRLVEDPAFRVQIEPSAASDTPPVCVDADLVVGALLGLLRNADDAGATRVLVRVGGSGDAPWIELADDGPGVPEDLRDQVGTPFFTTKAQGTGLGLAMAGRVAAAHGGALRYRDGHGLGPAGACFRLTLGAAG